MGAIAISPCLTWLHLLAADVGCDVDGAPDWFRLPARARASGGRRVRVVFDRAFPGGAAGLTDAHGLLAVNCRGLSAESLRAAGFVDVRRYAVLPRLRNARWFIPIDDPAAASAGFCLYTPTRLLARVKRAAARVGARARLPFWYSDHLWIAQRSLAPIEQFLQPLFPGTPFRLALSSGAPEPARNRKASVAVIGPGGRLLAFAKASGSPLASALIRSEAATLEAFAARPGLSGSTPRLIAAARVEETEVSVQTPLPGRPAGARLSAAHHRLLGRLRVGPWKPATATNQVASLPSRLASLLAPRPDLAAVLDDLLPHLEGVVVPETIVHGDFAPWNLLEHRGEVTAFDWEYAELSGLPLADELHHRLQVGYHVDGWSTRQACEFLAAHARAGPMGLRPREVAALQAVYLLDILVRLLNEGYDDDPALSWNQSVLMNVANAFRGITVP